MFYFLFPFHSYGIPVVRPPVYIPVLKRFKVVFDPGCEATINTTDGTPLPSPQRYTVLNEHIYNRYYWRFQWRQASQMHHFPRPAYTWYAPSFPRPPATECSASLSLEITFSHSIGLSTSSTPRGSAHRRRCDYEHVLQAGSREDPSWRKLFDEVFRRTWEDLLHNTR